MGDMKSVSYLGAGLGLKNGFEKFGMLGAQRHGGTGISLSPMVLPVS